MWMRDAHFEEAIKRRGATKARKTRSGLIAFPDIPFFPHSLIFFLADSSTASVSPLTEGLKFGQLWYRSVPEKPIVS